MKFLQVIGVLLILIQGSWAWDRVGRAQMAPVLGREVSLTCRGVKNLPKRADMDLQKETAKMVAGMLAKLRESNVHTIGDDPTPFPAVYGIDELVEDKKFPDILALAIANHFRWLAGEIKQDETRQTGLREGLEEIASEGIGMIFSTIGEDEEKAKFVTHWMYDYLFASLAYRSKVISDALKSANAARDL
jgi:hypothetical protein